jgi:hypothetical protein
MSRLTAAFSPSVARTCEWKKSNVVLNFAEELRRALER